MANEKIAGNADNINNTLQKDNARIGIASDIKNNSIIKKFANAAWQEFVYKPC